MRTKVSTSVQHPRLVIAIAIGMASIVWGVCLYSLVSQIGQPFPGFLYDPDRIVNAFNTEDLTG